MTSRITKKILLVLSVSIMFFGLTPAVQAGIISDLKDKITNKTSEIKKVREEIEQYTQQVKTTNAQARTLQSEIYKLSTTEKNLKKDIRSTSNNIGKTEKTIRSLAQEIEEKQKGIKTNEKDLSKTLRTLHELESRSLVEIILSQGSFSSFWDNVESLSRFQTNVHTSIQDLKKLKESIEDKKTNFEQEKSNLIAYETRLTDKKKIVQNNKQIQDRLLKDTKNKESQYKKILADRIAQQEALEREIAEFEERLRVEIDPSSLPKTGTGVLTWPLKKVRITQYFGKTAFATKNAQVYNGSGHNGIDLGAPVGTALHAAAAGVIIGVADTDKQCYKASYGKWVLIRHYNGLSTLYAHMSLIKVNTGQEVHQDDIIGYSGNTGYSTGPHLHFTVFASKAVQVSNSYTSRVCGTQLTLPLSAKNGYLNPLSYLTQ